MVKSNDEFMGSDSSIFVFCDGKFMIQWWLGRCFFDAIYEASILGPVEAACVTIAKQQQLLWTMTAAVRQDDRH